LRVVCTVDGISIFECAHHFPVQEPLYAL
jgi:hypothetical protein